MKEEVKRFFENRYVEAALINQLSMVWIFIRLTIMSMLISQRLLQKMRSKKKCGVVMATKVPVVMGLI